MAWTLNSYNRTDVKLSTGVHCSFRPTHRALGQPMLYRYCLITGNNLDYSAAFVPITCSFQYRAVDKTFNSEIYLFVAWWNTIRSAQYVVWSLTTSMQVRRLIYTAQHAQPSISPFFIGHTIITLLSVKSATTVSPTQGHRRRPHSDTQGWASKCPDVKNYK